MTDIPTLSPIAGPSEESAAAIARIREEAARVLYRHHCDGPARPRIEIQPEYCVTDEQVAACDAVCDGNRDRIIEAARRYVERMLGDWLHDVRTPTGCIDGDDDSAIVSLIVRVRVRV